MKLRYFGQYLYSHNTLIFCEKYIENVQQPFISNDISFSTFNMSDMGSLEVTLREMDFKSEFTLKDISQRLDKGYFFYLIRCKERIIGYCWWAVRQYCIPYFDGIIELNDNELFCFNNYIHRDFRGRGIFNNLRVYAYKDFIRHGFKRDILCYFTWNTAARRMNEKFGFSPMGTVDFGYLATLRYIKKTVASNAIVIKSSPFVLWGRLLAKLRKAGT